MKRLTLVVVLGALFSAVGCDSGWSDRKVTESIKAGDVIVAALGRYRSTNGSYPRHLEALVPGNLTRIPPPTAGTQVWDYSVTEDGQDFGLALYRSKTDPEVWLCSAKKGWIHRSRF